MAEPTPRPWRAVHTSVRAAVYPTDHRLIADCWNSVREAEEDEANAALIVKAVNSHQALIEALRFCIAWMPKAEVHNWPPGFRLRDEALEAARAALELAGVKP